MCGGKWLQHLAHRVAWELFKGPIPPDKWVLHKCDNPKCVRPTHLFLGTAQDNTDDMLQKGRFTPAKGSDQGHAVLSEDVIADVFMLHQNGWTQKLIGQRYGIAQQTVSDVLRRKAWRHVSV
jgi:HNH endonuclease